MSAPLRHTTGVVRLRDGSARRAGACAVSAPAGVLAVAFAVLLTAPDLAVAQEPDSAQPAVDTVIVAPGVPLTAVPVEGDTTPQQPMSPRGAFIRSMILPGWGQAAFGSYFRGGVYFAGWAGNWFMNFRNAYRLDNARGRFELREGELRDSLIFSPPSPGAPPNPDSMRAVLDTTDLLGETVQTDSAGNRLRKLVRAREQQREDWIAWTIFWLLASGIDGYVTAHLADFPATIDVDPGQDGSVSFRIEVPFGTTGRRKR